MTTSSDWRDGIGFETPVLLAAVLPGEDARCVTCGADSAARSRDELWAVKHRHPKHHNGFVRFYCREHTPAPPAVPREPAAERGRARPAARAARPAATRRPAVVETPRALCPDCFVEVPSHGVCGICGQTV